MGLVRPYVVIRIFVLPCSEYCNPLLNGITDGLPHRLLSVQNAAARFVMDARRVDQATPLHWLPVDTL